MSKYKIVGQKEFDEVIKRHEDWMKENNGRSSICPIFSGFEYRNIKIPAEFQLEQMNFEKCRFVDCDFSEIYLERCDFDDSVEFVNCNFGCSYWPESDRGYVNHINATFKDCDFTDASFVRCAMKKAQFIRCDFTDAELLNCELGRNTFSCCNLTLKDATPATLELIRLINEINFATIKCLHEYWGGEK